MNFRKIMFTAFAVMLAVGVSSAYAGDKLRIGVEGAYPPFSWKEPDGTLKGFDIEIAHMLCAKMDTECELVEQDWDGIIPALLAKKYDAIVASMSITDERKKRVDFTNKYYDTPARFIAADSAGLEVSASGLAGKRIGVQRGTIHQCWVEKGFPDAELVLYGTQEEVFQDLASGRIDAQLSDSLQGLEGFLNTDAGHGYSFVGGDQIDLPCFGEGAGVAVRKGSEDLVQAFNNAIQAIRADGSYEALSMKYFGTDIYGAGS